MNPAEWMMGCLSKVSKPINEVLRYSVSTFSLFLKIVCTSLQYLFKLNIILPQTIALFVKLAADKCEMSHERYINSGTVPSHEEVEMLD